MRPNFDRLKSRFYLAFDGADEKIASALGEVIENGGEIAVLTEKIAEADMQQRLSTLGAKPLSVIRFI